MHRRKLHYYLPNVLLTFLLTFAVLALAAAVWAFNVVLQSDTYTDQMYKNKVDEIAFDEINDYFDRQYNYSGVDPDVFKSAVKKKDIAASIYAYIDGTFEYMNGKNDKLPEFEYSYEPLEEALHNDYLRWCKENKKEYDNKMRNMENKTISNVEEIIDSKLDIMMLSKVNKPNGISTKVRHRVHLLNYALWGSIALTAVIVGVMALVNRKHIKYIFYWIFIACFCSGVLLIIPTAIARATKYFDGLVIHNQSVYKAFVYSLYSISDKLMITGFVLVGVGLAMLVIFIAAIKNMFDFKYRK